MSKLVRRIILGVVGVLFAAVAGFGGWLATSLPWQIPLFEWRIDAPGISKPVRVLPDENGVPTITAETADDAYFALGYVHARERFWQMESMRRFGAGRLAEVLGPVAIDSDKWMRTLGLYHLAEQSFDALPDPTKKALQAYAKGVNHWLATDVGLPSLEFALLRYKPEPWKPAESLVWGKIMAARLGGNWGDEALRARIAAKIGPEKVRELWPSDPPGAPVTIADVRAGAGAAASLAEMPAWPLEKPGAPRGASNVWALAPSRTDSSGAFLVNDPHLGFQAPIMWYLARIEGPVLNVSGATVPGVPFVILGHNASIAWGMTSTQSDIADLFIEKLADGDPDKYVAPDGPKDFDSREEIIRVKGERSVVLKVRSTRHGPVISDLRARMQGIIGEGYVVSLAATYLQPGDMSSSAFHDLNRAKDWIEFNKAVSHLQAPQQNFAYADIVGSIGFLTAGLVPKRRSGRGYVPTNGWTGETDWDGMVGFADLPKIYKPSNGIVINANNGVAPPDDQVFLGFDWAPPYRAQRIRKMIDTGSSQNSSGQAHMLRDARSLMAADLLGPMLAAPPPDTPLAKKAHDMLAKWNHEMAHNVPEPLIFMAWLAALNRSLYGDELGELTDEFIGARPLLVKSILTRRTEWCDDVRTADKKETCADILQLSLKIALDDLAKQFGTDPKKWQWGSVHQAKFRHALFTHVPVLHYLADLQIPTDGGESTVNRGAVRFADKNTPFAHIHGPGYRAIYDLKDLRRSRFIIATGQSGNPLALNYRNLLGAWADGRLLHEDPPRRSADKREGYTLVPVTEKR
jgi:penicillin amidase